MHRPSTLDVVEHEKLRLTTAARALVDTSPGCSDNELRKALANADFRGRLDPDALRSLMGKGVEGSAALRQAVENHMPELARTLSPLEDRLFFLCESYGLPLPEPNVWVDGFRVDAIWRRERVVVEVDGRAAHSSPMQKRRDGARSTGSE